MTNQQYKILKYCFKRPRTLTEIREKVLKINENDFLMVYQSILDKELDDYTCFDKDNNNWMNSKLSLGKSGVEIVEKRRQETVDRVLNNIEGWITTAVALAGLIISIISLTWTISKG